MTNDLTSRQVVKEQMIKYGFHAPDMTVTEFVEDLPSVKPKTGYWKDFALWVANEIFDDTWEYNKDAFAEIACRKLNKLGIVKAIGDEWELTESYKDADIPLAESKTGHWIDADGDNAICGCCNCLNHLYGAYCKHCGAKMIKP